MDESEWILLGKAAYPEAKRLQAALDARGVVLRLSSDPSSCGSCSPQLDLRVRRQDLERVQAHLAEEHARSMSGLEHDAELADEVFDPERATARCPACATEFSTELRECPDCGLCFVAG